MTKITINAELKNDPREEIVKNFNISYAQNELEKVLDYLSEDIEWNLVGSNVVNGKDGVKSFMNEMGGGVANEVVINNILIVDNKCVCDGIMDYGDTVIGFCDIYTFDPDSKIKEMISYGVDIKK